MTGSGSVADAAPVITGISVVAPTGIGTENYWRATVVGTNALGRITRFDVRGHRSVLAGEIRHFEPVNLSGRLLPQTDISTRHALVASDAAIADAGIGPDDRDDTDLGVVTASTSGGFEFGQRELQKLWGAGHEYVSGYQSFAWFYAVNTGQTSIRHGARGPSSVLVADQAGGLDAFATARRIIRSGTPIVLTGGFDSVLSPWGWTATTATLPLSDEIDPAIAYRPFHPDANGYVAGEGGAYLVLEDAGRAADRGVTGYALLAGHAAGFDPAPESGRPKVLGRVIADALDDAQLSAHQVDVVFADAAAVPDDDRAEIDSLVRTFGIRGVPVTAPKTGTGRLFGGAGAVDVAAAALSLASGVIPPTPGAVDHPELPLDLVRRARRADPRTALVISRGSGFTSAVLLTRPERPRTVAA